MIDFQLLIKSGCHFGHQKSRGCSKMAPYIWGHRNGVHLINVSKTAVLLEQAALFLKEVAREGKSVLWVGTKKPAQDVVFGIAQDLKMPYVNHRWIGGTLSNFDQVKKSVTRLLHYQDVIKKVEQQPDAYHYTKKEMTVINKRIDRLNKNIGGICGLTWPIGAVFLIDVRKEQSAVREAARMGIPVVAIVDTNGDPSAIDYIIPGNDDAPRSIKCIADYLHQAVKEGLLEYEQKQKEQKEQAELEKSEKKKALAEKAAEQKEFAKKDAPIDAVKAEKKEVKKGPKRVAPSVKTEKQESE
jgi:small subunit ribosomal protein S2